MTKQETALLGKLFERIAQMEQLITQLINTNSNGQNLQPTIPIMTHKEAANYLGITTQTLYNLVNKGKIAKVEAAGQKKNCYLKAELNKYKYGGEFGEKGIRAVLF
ncbi:MAG: helix-turn-helix domain-containing protein [Bacteroidia bacterium]